MSSSPQGQSRVTVSASWNKVLSCININVDGQEGYAETFMTLFVGATWEKKTEYRDAMFRYYRDVDDKKSVGLAIKRELAEIMRQITSPHNWSNHPNPRETWHELRHKAKLAMQRRMYRESVDQKLTRLEGGIDVFSQLCQKYDGQVRSSEWWEVVDGAIDDISLMQSHIPVTLEQVEDSISKTKNEQREEVLAKVQATGDIIDLCEDGHDTPDIIDLCEDEPETSATTQTQPQSIIGLKREHSFEEETPIKRSNATVSGETNQRDADGDTVVADAPPSNEHDPLNPVIDELDQPSISRPPTAPLDNDSGNDEISPATPSAQISDSAEATSDSPPATASLITHLLRPHIAIPFQSRADFHLPVQYGPPLLPRLHRPAWVVPVGIVNSASDIVGAPNVAGIVDHGGYETLSLIDGATVYIGRIWSRGWEDCDYMTDDYHPLRPEQLRQVTWFHGCEFQEDRIKKLRMLENDHFGEDCLVESIRMAQRAKWIIENRRSQLDYASELFKRKKGSEFFDHHFNGETALSDEEAWIDRQNLKEFTGVDHKYASFQAPHFYTQRPAPLLYRIGLDPYSSWSDSLKQVLQRFGTVLITNQIMRHALDWVLLRQRVPDELGRKGVPSRNEIRAFLALCACAWCMLTSERADASSRNARRIASMPPDQRQRAREEIAIALRPFVLNYMFLLHATMLSAKSAHDSVQYRLQKLLDDRFGNMVLDTRQHTWTTVCMLTHTNCSSDAQLPLDPQEEELSWIPDTQEDDDRSANIVFALNMSVEDAITLIVERAKSMRDPNASNSTPMSYRIAKANEEIADDFAFYPSMDRSFDEEQIIEEAKKLKGKERDKYLLRRLEERIKYFKSEYTVLREKYDNHYVTQLGGKV